jgi:hypothetical protein
MPGRKRPKSPPANGLFHRKRKGNRMTNAEQITQKRIRRLRDAALKKSERYMRLHGLSNDPGLREKYLRTAQEASTKAAEMEKKGRETVRELKE